VADDGVGLAVGRSTGPRAVSTMANAAAAATCVLFSNTPGLLLLSLDCTKVTA
jgi:hypothetical protein